MAYFNNDPRDAQEDEYQPVFQQPVEDDYLDDEYYDEDGSFHTDEMYYDDFLSEEERREAHRMKWKMLAGIGDFIGVLAGTVVILLLVALLISLITWVQADISQSFTLWQTKL